MEAPHTATDGGTAQATPIDADSGEAPEKDTTEDTADEDASDMDTAEAQESSGPFEAPNPSGTTFASDAGEPTPTEDTAGSGVATDGGSSPVAAAEGTPQDTSACQVTTGQAFSLAGTASGLNGLVEAYTGTDGTSSICSSLGLDGVCISGWAPSSSDGQNDFAYWGSFLGLRLAPEGASVDLAALGVVAVRLRVDGVYGREIRVSAMQASDPTAADPTRDYGTGAFQWGGSAPNMFGVDFEVEAPLADFTLPDWTQLRDAQGNSAVGAVIDISQVTALEIGAPNDPQSIPAEYGFCVREVTWLNEQGEAVDLDDVTTP